jgi:hypothetical protein
LAAPPVVAIYSGALRFDLKVDLIKSCGSDTERRRHGDPIGAPESMWVQTARRPTLDPRQQGGPRSDKGAPEPTVTFNFLISRIHLIIRPGSSAFAAGQVKRHIKPDGA